MRIWSLKSKDPQGNWVVDTCMRLTPDDVVVLYDILDAARSEYRGGHAELIEFTLRELERLEELAKVEENAMGQGHA